MSEASPKSSAISHHPSIAQFEPAEGEIPEGSVLDYFGFICIKAVHPSAFPSFAADDPTPFNNQTAYQTRDVADMPKKFQKSSMPAFGEEYLEAIDLVESIQQSDDHYTMFELGAGFGKWGIRAYQFIRRHFPEKKSHIVFVEPEPVHCNDLRYHLKLNNIPEKDAVVLEAAVSTVTKLVPFCVSYPESNHPHKWYGQFVDHGLARIQDQTNAQASNFIADGTYYNGKPMYHDKSSGYGIIMVPCVTLSKILQSCPRVDLIHMDIQGEDAEVVIEAIEELNKRVKRLHIGTNDRYIESRLRKVLGEENKWTCLCDFEGLKENDTIYGKITFNDGIQTWINPRLA
jgi:FkbM family methyltransferase